MTSDPLKPSRGRILAVDDEETMRELLAGGLEAQGFSVAAVDSGFAALEATKAEAFDAVILDVEMPDMDGIELGLRMRSDPGMDSAMIAMHTSLDESAVRLRFDRYDAFLPKPCSPAELSQRLGALIEAKRNRD